MAEALRDCTVPLAVVTSKADTVVAHTHAQVLHQVLSKYMGTTHVRYCLLEASSHDGYATEDKEDVKQYAWVIRDLLKQ